MAQIEVSGVPGRARVLTVAGKLDPACARALHFAVRALLVRSSGPLVVDLSGVRSANPLACWAALHALATEASVAGVDLRLVSGLSPAAGVRDLLESDLFRAYLTLEQALRSDR